jgi:predicted nucleic acid-binding protein
LQALKHRPGLRLAELSIIEIISEPPPLPADLQKPADELALHAGERAALAVLKARGGHFLLSDDVAARTVALAVGFHAHGTMGLILRSRRRGNISKAEMLQLLRELPTRTTLHLRKELLDIPPVATKLGRAKAETITKFQLPNFQTHSPSKFRFGHFSLSVIGICLVFGTWNLEKGGQWGRI